MDNDKKPLSLEDLADILSLDRIRAEEGLKLAAETLATAEATLEVALALMHHLLPETQAGSLTEFVGNHLLDRAQLVGGAIDKTLASAAREIVAARK